MPKASQRGGVGHPLVLQRYFVRDAQEYAEIGATPGGLSRMVMRFGRGPHARYPWRNLYSCVVVQTNLWPESEVPL